MGPADHILAIDQGTTSTRAILFDRQARPVATAQRELTQHYPQSGWVEHDPEEIWRETLTVLREAASAVEPGRIASIGIANQRETVVVWDRSTGEPIHRAIVWQDRRTSNACEMLKDRGAEELVRTRTGLLLDPYFSATKIMWTLDHVPEARSRAERGELACGTIDCFLLWRLTAGAAHLTDVTNASRTSLFDIHRQCWDEELCRLFRVPLQLLPEVCDNSGKFGTIGAGVLDMPVPITGMAGDQQAALFGQACFEPGMAKSTYGTGCFMLVNTGDQPLESRHRLLTSPAYRLGGRTSYALEGSIFIAGAAVKWLRDGLGVIPGAADTEGLAAQVSESHGVTFVPAFVGLGAPYWDAEARAAIFGLTLGSTPADLARAALEAVAFQTVDLARAMRNDMGAALAALRIDGGMAANAWLCQFLADVLQLRIERPQCLETTALGAAFLAGLGSGVWSGLDEVARTWKERDCFVPAMEEGRRQRLIQGWRDAVAKTLTK